LLTVPLLADHDQRLFQVLLRLLHEEDGHRLSTGNWNSYQITQLDHVVQPTDSAQALSCSLFTLNNNLVNRIDSIWAARQQAAYFRAISFTPEVDPLTVVRALQRRCFQARSASASLPTIFYAVRLGHVPGIYTSLQEARPHTLGTHSDVKRFSWMKEEEENMAKSTWPGDPPLFDDPTAYLFTDGSAPPKVTFPGSPETQALWGPMITAAARPS